MKDLGFGAFISSLIASVFILFLYCGNNYFIIKDIKKELKEKDSLWNDLYYSIVDTMEKEAFLVTMTTYNATKEQCDNTPSVTASSLKVHKHSKYIALSRDLLEYFPYGSLVIIQNAGKHNGTYVVADCMSSRFLRHVDILIGNKQKHTKLNNVILKYADR